MTGLWVALLLFWRREELGTSCAKRIGMNVETHRQRNPALTQNPCVDTLARLQTVLEREIRTQRTCAVICPGVYMPMGIPFFRRQRTLSMSSTAARCTSLWVSSLRWT